MRKITEEQRRRACVHPTTVSTSVEIREQTIDLDNFKSNFEMPDAYKTLA